MRTRFTGVGTALVTPFRKDGSVDEAAVKRLARRQIDGGVHFLVPCGTTGESPTLTDEEKLRVCELVVEEANGAVPVLAGCGGYDTREVIRAAGELERVGVDGFLSVTPYYNKPTQEGLYQHYKAFAESTPLPIVLYSIQGRTGININVDTVVRLAEIKNIVAIKEASGNVVQMTEIVGQAPEDFLLLSGDDPLTVPIMAIGGRGVISVVSNEAPVGNGAGRRDVRARRLRRRAEAPALAAAAHPGQLRRVEPGAVQGGDGGDGAARGARAAAARHAIAGVARQDHERPAAAEDARRGGAHLIESRSQQLRSCRNAP